MGERIREHQSRIFYELEAQRVTRQDAIRAALQSAPSVNVCIDEWCRAIKLRYSHVPLSARGSLKQSGRFNYGADLGERFFPFPALYVAADRFTAHCEMVGHTREKDPTNGFTADELAMQGDSSIAWLALTGEISNVFDLTESRNLKAFVEVTGRFKLTRELRAFERRWGFSPTQVVHTHKMMLNTLMDSTWRAIPTHADVPANGQVFGQLVAAAGFEGIKFKSVRTGKLALAIFPRNFRGSTSLVKVTDAAPNAQCIELNSSTYADAEREF